MPASIVRAMWVPVVPGIPQVLTKGCTSVHVSVVSERGGMTGREKRFSWEKSEVEMPQRKFAGNGTPTLGFEG